MIVGRCHCGAVSWQHRGPVTAATICNCTACRRNGAIWAYGHQGVDVDLAAPEDGLIAYVQGDRLLALLICRTCGNLSAWRSLTTDGSAPRRMAVNLRLAEPAAVAAIPVKRFDGFDQWTTLPDRGWQVGDLMF